MKCRQIRRGEGAEALGEGEKKADWMLGSGVGFLSLSFQKKNNSGIPDKEIVWNVTMNVGCWNTGEGHWS